MDWILRLTKLIRERRLTLAVYERADKNSFKHCCSLTRCQTHPRSWNARNRPAKPGRAPVVQRRPYERRQTLAPRIEQRTTPQHLPRDWFRIAGTFHSGALLYTRSSSSAPPNYAVPQLGTLQAPLQAGLSGVAENVWAVRRYRAFTPTAFAREANTSLPPEASIRQRTAGRSRSLVGGQRLSVMKYNVVR